MFICKNSLIFTKMCQNTHFVIWYFNTYLQKPLHAPCIKWPKISITEVDNNQINRKHVFQFFKILLYFRNKSTRNLFFMNLVSPVIIIWGQNYFYQNLCLEEILSAMSLDPSSCLNFKIALPSFPTSLREQNCFLTPWNSLNTCFVFFFQNCNTFLI